MPTVHEIRDDQKPGTSREASGNDSEVSPFAFMTNDAGESTPPEPPDGPPSQERNEIKLARLVERIRNKMPPITEEEIEGALKKCRELLQRFSLLVTRGDVMLAVYQTLSTKRKSLFLHAEMLFPLFDEEDKKDFQALKEELGNWREIGPRFNDLMARISTENPSVVKRISGEMNDAYQFVGNKYEDLLSCVTQAEWLIGEKKLEERKFLSAKDLREIMTNVMRFYRNVEYALSFKELEKNIPAGLREAWGDLCRMGSPKLVELMTEAEHEALKAKYSQPDGISVEKLRIRIYRPFDWLVAYLHAFGQAYPFGVQAMRDYNATHRNTMHRSSAGMHQPGRSGEGETSLADADYRPSLPVQRTMPYGAQQREYDDIETFLQAQERSGSDLLGQRAADLEKEVRAFEELVADMKKSDAGTNNPDSSLMKELNAAADEATQYPQSEILPDVKRATSTASRNFSVEDAEREYFSGAANEKIKPFPKPAESSFLNRLLGTSAQDETIELLSPTAAGPSETPQSGSTLPVKTLAIATVTVVGVTWLITSIKNAFSSGVSRDQLISETMSLKVPEWDHDTLLEIMLEAAGITLDEARNWPYELYARRVRRAMHIPLVNGESALQIVERAVGKPVSQDEALMHITEKLRVAPWGETAGQSDTLASSSPSPDGANIDAAAAEVVSSLAENDQKNTGEGQRGGRARRTVASPRLNFFNSEREKTTTLSRLGETVTVLEFLQGHVMDILLDPAAGKLDSTISLRSHFGIDNYTAIFAAITEKLGLVKLDSTAMFAMDNMEFTTLRRIYDEVDQLIDETKWLIQRLQLENTEDVSDFITLLRHITNLRVIPPRPPARDSWNALTAGRNMYAVYDLYKSDAYKRLSSGLASRLTVAQKSLEIDLFGTSFSDQVAKFVQKSFRIADMNSDDPVAQKTRTWLDKNAADYQRLSDQNIKEKFRTFYNKQAIKNDLSSPQKTEEFKMRIKGIFLRDNFQNLIDELEKLPSHLVSSTQLAKLKEKTEKKMKEMQSLRYIMSGAAFWSVPNRMAQAYYAESPVQQTLAVASTLEGIFGAFNTPNLMGWTVYDGLKKGETFGKKFAATLTQGLESVTASESQNLKRMFSDTGRNGGLAVPKTKQIPKDVQKAISAQVKRDPTSLRSMVDSAKTLRKQGVMWNQRIAGLFMASYSFANLEGASSVQQAEGILRIVASSSFVAGTTIEITFKGDFAAKIAKWTNPTGIVAGWGAGTANIVGIYQRGGANRDRDVALASVQLALEMAATIGAIAFPLVFGTLALFIPNFEAIGAAMDFNKMAKDLEKEGRTLEAMVARKMRDMSIADAIPIANWFSFAYRPLMIQSITIPDSQILSQEATSYVAQLAAAWQKIADTLPPKIDDKPVYATLLVPYRGTMVYYRTNPQPHAMHRTVYDERNVTMWAAFHKDPEQKFHIVTDVAKTEMLRSLGPNRPLNNRREPWHDYEKFTHQWQIQAKKFDNRTLTTPHRANNPDRPQYILISAGTASPDHTLYLRDPHETRPGIYLLKDSAGKKIRMTAGAGNDTFVMDSMPQYLDGGPGYNVARFDVMPARVPTLNLNQAKNIHMWHGSLTTTLVTGTPASDNYVSTPYNAEEVVNAGAGDDAVMAFLGTANMGAGADRVFAMNVQVLADGGTGGGEEADFITYSESKLTDFSLNGERVAATDETETRRSGTLKNFEQIIATNNADSVTLSAGTSVQALDLLGGDDTLNLNGVSNIQAFTGEGNDRVTVGDNSVAYNNVALSTGAGDDTVSVKLKYGSQGPDKIVRVMTEEGNDLILLSKSPQSNRNDVIVQPGKGDDKTFLEGDIHPSIYFDNDDGVDHIYDHVDRTGPMILLFGGDLRKVDIVQTLMKDDGQVLDSAGNRYAWVIRLRGVRQGTLEINIHTFDCPEIYAATNADGESWKVDM